MIIKFGKNKNKKPSNATMILVSIGFIIFGLFSIYRFLISYNQPGFDPDLYVDRRMIHWAIAGLILVPGGFIIIWKTLTGQKT